MYEIIDVLHLRLSVRACFKWWSRSTCKKGRGLVDILGMELGDTAFMSRHKNTPSLSKTCNPLEESNFRFKVDSINFKAAWASSGVYVTLSDDLNAPSN